MLSIAKYLISVHEDYSVLLLSGSPMLHAFRIPQQLDYVKLPCLQRDSQGEYGVRTLAISMEDTVRLRANIILSTVMDYQPDVMIVDKKPLGICAELQPALKYLKGRSNVPRMILLLRDILDSPAATREVWQKRGYFDAIDNYYDRILVVGQPEIFDLAAEYAFPPAAKEKVEYCGYIRREPSPRGRQEVYAELGLDNCRKLVLITPGGGKDGAQLIINYLKGLREISDTAVHSLVLCGPEMLGEYADTINVLAKISPSVTILNFTDDLMSYMNAANIVVSMFGYNTMCEILTLKKSAVVVPRVRPVQEQWIRAVRMAELGLVKTIHPDHVNAENLSQAVNTLLSEQTQPTPVEQCINLDALPTIKRIIAADIEEQETKKEALRSKPEHMPGTNPLANKRMSLAPATAADYMLKIEGHYHV
jgi:predicted glycosyltransferase